MNVKEKKIILFVSDEFDGKQIQIHSNMHFHYSILNKHYQSKSNQSNFTLKNNIISLLHLVFVVDEQEFVLILFVPAFVHLHVFSLQHVVV